MENEKENILEKELLVVSLNDGHDKEKISRKEGDAQLDHDFDHLGESFEEDHKAIDYSSFSKKDFVQMLKDMSNENNFRHIDEVIKEAKPLFDEIRLKQRNDALQKFLAEGGKTEDFDFRPDEYDVAFDATLRLLKDRKANHFKNLEEEKNGNLRRKIEILEKLRALVDGEDSDQSFQQLKELQKEWKSVGAVPAAQVKSLWANYTALIDRYYDHRSIYFELKELDRKKNLEAKLELCVRAERLIDVAIIRDAVRELNDLHNEFKHVGPVPIEEKEKVWQRFKGASDAVYEKRDAYINQLQKDFQNNLVLKEQLINEVEQFSSFTSDRIKEWNQKTHEVLEVQKKWEAVGSVSRSKAKEVNKKFWTAFKTFFNNKNLFFKKLDEERDRNLNLKREIIAKANELKESQDWDKTADALKDLQKQWKEVGPVPEKFREKIFAEFKEACDHFFQQRRNQLEKLDQEQDENLKLKEAICADIEKGTEEKNGSLELLTKLSHQFNEIGYVPKKSISSIKTRFQNAVDKYIASLQDVNDEDKEKALLEIQLGMLKDDPNADQKLYHKEQAIRKRIMKVENDIALWRNNLEFFGRSKNAEKVKDEFNDKIKTASDHLKQLKSQLKMLKSVS